MNKKFPPFFPYLSKKWVVWVVWGGGKQTLDSIKISYFFPYSYEFKENHISFSSTKKKKQLVDAVSSNNVEASMETFKSCLGNKKPNNYIYQIRVF